MKRRETMTKKDVSRETFSARFQIARDASGLKPNEFEGMASVFHYPIDTWTPTIIEPGAFKKTIAERASQVKVLWQHDSRYPIGIPTLMEETPQGLHVRAQISETSVGKDALMLIRDGVVDSMSIGFDAIQEDPVKHDLNWMMEQKSSSSYEPTVLEKVADGATWRHLKEIRLWEFSPVTFPANDGAGITAVHSMFSVPLESFAAKWEIQTIIFPKSKWDSADACKKWLKDHDYKDPGVDETEDSYRFRQRDPSDFDKMRTICINPGKDAPMDDCKVKAVYGQLKSSSQAITTPSLEALEPVLLELHEGKVLSTKNKKLLQDAVAALQALIAAAEPPPPKDEGQALTVNAERMNKLRTAKLRFRELQHSTQ